MGGPADIHILRNMYTKSCILTVFFFIILPRTHTANLHAHKNRKDYLSKLLTGYTPAHTHTHICIHKWIDSLCVHQKNSVVAQLDKTCPRSRCFISSRLFIPVCFTSLASENILQWQWRISAEFQTYNLSSAVLWHRVCCTPSWLIRALKRHYSLVTLFKKSVNISKKR